MFILPAQAKGARASPFSTLMGPGNCFRSLKKAKEGTSRQAKVEVCAAKSNGSKQDSQRKWGIPGKRVEDTAATRIQAAFRAFLARRTLYRLRCAVRFQSLTHGLPVTEQVSTALSYLHSWSRIQTEIRARRINMVTEARMRQKRLEDQLKFEAKLQKLELEWCGGPGTKEDILAKIQQREAAAAKRERTLAYAFSHQWRANSSHYLSRPSYCLVKECWGWSWLEHWIATRPWEIRPQSYSTEMMAKQLGKSAKPCITQRSKQLQLYY
ncbi:protein IQ-DOMAIN 1 isoform X1 [Eucalyptus grandis]|uniref:protein IQ-DOMAIN 1 isoform X1 n=1 Tax=Eucalyptus grandis TaxID=71139 RepID=UPI00192EEFF7|nr:protein IQ-DOMAIN 1 isoform X1 [Eucalyptus grandis]XP_039171297.1 protein IQ-DOMAIN 1 isoform X1 [Eucalyptus grandis]